MADDEKGSGVVGAIVGIAASILGAFTGSSADSSHQYADHSRSQQTEREAQAERDSKTERDIERRGR